MTSLLAKIFGSVALFAMIGALGWHFLGQYATGQQAIGAARVQATIDTPVTGWAARLAACEANGRALQAGLDAQSAAALAKSTADTAALAQSTAALHMAQAATTRAQGAAGRILAPLPAGPTCDRLNEVDKRLMEGVQ